MQKSFPKSGLAIFVGSIGILINITSCGGKPAAAPSSSPAPLDLGSGSSEMGSGFGSGATPQGIDPLMAGGGSMASGNTQVDANANAGLEGDPSANLPVDQGWGQSIPDSTGTDGYQSVEKSFSISSSLNGSLKYKDDGVIENPSSTDYELIAVSCPENMILDKIVSTKNEDLADITKVTLFCVNLNDSQTEEKSIGLNNPGVDFITSCTGDLSTGIEVYSEGDTVLHIQAECAAQDESSESLSFSNKKTDAENGQDEIGRIKNDIKDIVPNKLGCTSGTVLTGLTFIPKLGYWDRTKEITGSLNPFGDDDDDDDESESEEVSSESSSTSESTHATDFGKSLESIGIICSSITHG